MKKTTMKIFGVCAATLMTVGVVAPLTTQATEATEGIQSTVTNVTATPMNLKSDATVSITELDAFASWVDANKVNTTAIEGVNPDTDSIAMTDVSTPYFNDLFLDWAEGKVAQNVGLSFDNPNGDDVDTLIANIFGGQTPNPDYDPSAPEFIEVEVENPNYYPEVNPETGIPNPERPEGYDNNPTITEQQENPAYGQPEFIGGSASNGIYMTSNMGVDGNIYQAGDTVTLYFWTDYGVGNSNQLRKLKEVTVTFQGVGEGSDYQATANNLNKQVGDLYAPFENVSVTNKETGAALKPVVIAQNGGTTYYINKKGVATELTSGNFSDELNNQDSALYNTVYTEFGYEIGEFYFVQDTSYFTAGNRVKEEVVDVNGVTREVIRTYNLPVSNFNQNLMIVVPYFENTSTTQPSVETMYVSRLVNVSENGTVNPDPEVTAVPVYRVYNPNNGEHLFTTSQAEYNWLVGKGWTAENVAWQSPSEGTPVYRLYNPNSGEHFYTDNVSEYDNVASKGWTKEGLAFFSADAEDGLPVYRSFNPNAKDAGSHMFTLSLAEYNNLTAAGWSPEGVAFYALNTAE